MRTLLATLLLLSCDVTPDAPDATIVEDVAEVIPGETPEDCDDDLFCTTDWYAEGVCIHEVVPYFCAISGVCVPDLPGSVEAPADNPCVSCEPDVDPEVWTPANEDFQIGDGRHCHDGYPCGPDDDCDD